jgi:hypothetical protein
MAKPARSASEKPLAPNAFIGWKTPPSDTDLASVLGPLAPLWDQLTDGLAEELGLTEREWKSYGIKHGWALRLKRGKRNIVHIAPCQGSIRVLLILGDRAVKAARTGGLGASITKLLDEAPRYPEGTGIRLEVKGPRAVTAIKKLARIKLEN